MKQSLAIESAMHVVNVGSAQEGVRVRYHVAQSK